MVYLYDSLQLAVLLQQPCLFLLQGENVLCRLLQDGSLFWGGGATIKLRDFQ